MSNREAFENSEESITLLLIYDHATHYVRTLRFVGHDSYNKAIDKRDTDMQENNNSSYTFIANKVAEVEYENCVLDNLNLGHEIDEQL